MGGGLHSQHCVLKGRGALARPVIAPLPVAGNAKDWYPLQVCKMRRMPMNHHRALAAAEEDLLTWEYRPLPARRRHTGCR